MILILPSSQGYNTHQVLETFLMKSFGNSDHLKHALLDLNNKNNNDLVQKYTLPEITEICHFGENKNFT